MKKAIYFIAIVMSFVTVVNAQAIDCRTYLESSTYDDTRKTTNISTKTTKEIRSNYIFPISSLYPIVLYKMSSSKNIVYSLNLSTSASSAGNDVAEVRIVFFDETEYILKEAQVVYDFLFSSIHGPFYTANSSFKIDNELLDMLKIKKVKSFYLNSFNNTLKLDTSSFFNNAVTCLTENENKIY